MKIGNFNLDKDSIYIIAQLSANYNENLQNAVKDLGNKQEASVNSKEVSATDKFSGSSTTEENIVKDVYFKEKGITLDKKANVYDVFTKGDKVLYKNAYDILYNRDGKRIGFLGEDGAFHLHEPKGGYPKNSLEDVGIIKNKYEGRNGIIDFSNYKNPLDEENVDPNINKTEKTNPPTTEENASKEEVVVKDTQKPEETSEEKTSSSTTEENTTKEEAIQEMEEIAKGLKDDP